MWNWFKNRNESELVRRYRKNTLRKSDRKTPASELQFIALDAETTGFDVDTDRLLSIAVVPIIAGKLDIEGRRTWLVQQTASPNNEAVKTHGIAPAESAQGIPENTALAELLGVIAGKIIGGHHIGFDAGVIGAALKRHWGVSLRNRLVDTALMSMRHIDAFHRTGYANQRPPSLDEVCQHAGLPVMGRHTASGDAFTTGQLFLWLCGRQRVRFKRELTAGDF